MPELPLVGGEFAGYRIRAGRQPGGSTAGRVSPVAVRAEYWNLSTVVASPSRE